MTSAAEQITLTAQEETFTAHETSTIEEPGINPHLLAVESTLDTHLSTSQLQSLNMEMQQTPVEETQLESASPGSNFCTRRPVTSATETTPEPLVRDFPGNTTERGGEAACELEDSEEEQEV